MTENQAIKIIKQEKQWESNARISDAFEMAIKALEEIQQYRAHKEIFESHFSKDALELLSDKEEFGKWLERGRWIAKRCDEINRELEQYRAIGSVEKVTKLKELYDKAKWLIDDERKKRRSFEAIGTIEEFKALKAKEHNYDNCHNYTCRKKCEKDGYKKAIDEFAERLRMNTSEYEVMDGFGAIEEIVDAVDIDTIFEIAEQMKGGE